MNDEAKKQCIVIPVSINIPREIVYIDGSSNIRNVAGVRGFPILLGSSRFLTSYSEGK